MTSKAYYFSLIQAGISSNLLRQELIIENVVKWSIFVQEIKAMSTATDFRLQPVGFIRSTITRREEAPRQGYEGAPDAFIEIEYNAKAAMDGLAMGEEIIVITWFHQSKRDVLKVHPRGDLNNPLTGVFATRSPDRPNPLGLHRVTILEIKGNTLKVGPLEAIDGTPVVDIKPVLTASQDA